MAQVNTQTQKLTGRNAGARRGAAQSNPKANIGSHMAGKDQTPAVRTVPQVTDAQVAGPKKALVIEAQKIIHGFRSENEKLASIKKQAEAQRGGLSDIVFRIVTLGWKNAPKPELAFVFCQSLLDSAELAERVEFQRTQKLEETPTARIALGSSWQTYKSQILKCVKAGYDPTQFENGTKYRDNVKAPPRQPRTPAAGEEAATDTLAATMAAKETVALRTELQAAIVEFIDACKGSDETDQLKHANNLHKLTVKIATANKANEEAAPANEERATGTM